MPVRRAQPPTTDACQRGESVQTTATCASFAFQAFPPTIFGTSMMSALTENGAASHIEELSPKPETFLRITTDVGRRLTCLAVAYPFP